MPLQPPLNLKTDENDPLSGLHPEGLHLLLWRRQRHDRALRSFALNLAEEPTESCKKQLYGSRRITVTLNQEEIVVSHLTVQRYMREIGISGIAPGPNTSKAAPEHKIFPYLLRHVSAEYLNHVQGMDITYIRL